MAQSDYLGAVPASSGLNVRVNLNGADAALASEHEGASAPTRTWPHMPWRDHASGKRWRRDASNAAWLVDEVYAAAADPGADDDEAAGYAIGVRWVNATAGRTFVCADATEGAAVWHSADPAATATIGRAKAPPEISNNATDADNDLDIAAGTFLSDEGVPITLAALTKRLDATFAEGTDAGGLDTGTKAGDSWYAVFAIAKADGTADVVFSTDGASPTMPTGYVRKRRIGWRRTDGSGNWLACRQEGDRVWWADSPTDMTALPGVWPNTALTVSTPPGVLGLFRAKVSETGTDVPEVSLSPTWAAAEWARVVGIKGNGGTCIGLSEASCPVDGNGQIRVSRGTAPTGFSLSCLGWLDSRGRDQ
jgi:hypothetical protein